MDAQLLPKKSSSLLSPQIIAITNQPGYIVYQRIFILFLSRSDQLFRETNGSSMLSKLQACGVYNQSLIDNIATTAKAQVLACLDQSDKQLISNLQVSVDIESIHIKVTLIDGVTYQGAIDVE